MVLQELLLLQAVRRLLQDPKAPSDIGEILGTLGGQRLACHNELVGFSVHSPTLKFLFA